MSLGRILGTSAAVVTVGAAAVAVVGMASAQTGRRPLPERRSSAAALARAIPAQLPVHSVHTAHTVHTAARQASRAARAVRVQPEVVTVPKTAAATTDADASTSAPVTSLAPAPPARPAVTPAVTVARSRRAVETPSATVPTVPTTTAPKPKPTPTPTPTHRVTHAATPYAAPQRGVRLPVSGTTGRATRVITVRAGATWQTVATLQAWRKAPGGGWLRVGKAATAHIGSDGMSRSPSESRSATPIGSFTLTQAFGYYSNPGTHLHYFRTTSADWWISQSGPLYNTHRRCWSNCRFNQGSPNEHLKYETPFYNYAVVIDYNTRNSPTGVRQGAGSAFFLHVTDGNPTAGCVAIKQRRLKPIMRWLIPAAHPRILIGTS